MKKKFERKDLEAKSILLTNIQKEVLFGSLLGDCSLSIERGCKNARGKIEHSQKQSDYLYYKKQLLNNLTSDVRFSERLDKRTNKVYKSCNIRFKSNPCLNEFYNLFYNKIKIVPDNLSLLTPLALAIWFMDDGVKATHKGYYFSTNGFKLEYTEKLKDYLIENYKLDCTLHNKGKGHYTIYIKRNSAYKFEELVKNYIPECMKYKLHTVS